MDLQNADALEKLATRVEEAARSTREGVRHFIEPARGTLRRATSKRHHIVFGRRGSGKSSLLRKAAADLTVDRRPIAYVDLEPFKGHSYPDVLLSVLIATFREFEEWLKTAAINPSTKVSWWQRIWGSPPSRASFNRKQSMELAASLAAEIANLERQLHGAEDAELKVTTTAKQEDLASEELSVGLSNALASASAKANAGQSQSSSEEIQEHYKRTKIDFLHRHIMDYQRLFQRMTSLSGGESFLFLDDLYHIRRSDQPRTVDYVHRIAKNQGLWLKIGTIKHRSEWYVAGDPPMGVKLEDDADEIDLDLTLEKYELAKDFLMRILKNFAAEVGLAPSQFLTDGAAERLVVASGGVARDFLSIFRRSIDVARERMRGASEAGGREKIGVEDVNNAAGEYDSSKREEFQRDTSDDQQSLNVEFQKIRDFCLTEANCNCFLLDKDARGPEVQMIHELVDLKLLHLIRQRVTVKKGRAGKIYEAYMLDLSQYAGARKRRGLSTIEFWKSEATKSLRRASLIYAIPGDPPTAKTVQS